MADPVLTAMFTPARGAVGQYEVLTTESPLDDVVAQGRSDGFQYGDPERLEPLDAFGRTGSYDRFAVARLYGGRRARVAHGWRAARGHFESVTLVSPYPDASLSRLLPGTMLIRWRL